MKDLWTYLQDSTKPIVLYGMGNGADKIISVLNRYNIKISGVFASDGFVRKKMFYGFPVTDYETAKNTFGDMIVLVCFGSSLPDVIDNIKRISREQELYAPDVPVFGDTLFDMQYVLQNKDSLEWVYSRLADEWSKKVFECAVMYKLTGKIEYLFECETVNCEIYKNILKLSNEETYFDLGAYRGDTVDEFLQNATSYKKIIAVEPDLKTYNKLCLATSHIKNITNINACVSDIDGQMLFDMQGSRGSNIGKGNVNIDSITIDSLAENCAPTYIKMDIEGAESAAIKGGAKCIAKHKPKMQIAAYHRSEDLILIPQKVFKINPDYKIYLRHFPSLPCWDMSYYFI